LGKINRKSSCYLGENKQEKLMFSCGQNKQEKLVNLWETITKGYVFLLKILTAKAHVVLFIYNYRNFSF
jgi:hypothetical protein